MKPDWLTALGGKERTVRKLTLKSTKDETQPADEQIRAVMREMGRRGGKKGGVARAEKLSPERRRQIASTAAKKRWGKA
jgi:hypothetical protein